MAGCSVLGCKCCGHTTPMRYVVVLLLLFLVIIAYAQRVCFNIVIVEMSEPTKQTVSECPLPEGKNTSIISNIEGGKYQWDETAQAILLAFFYLGYIPVHFPIGMLCDKYGARWPVMIGMIVSTVCTFLMPVVVTNMHYGFVAALRFTVGAGQGVVFPGISSYLSRWIPANERATMGGIVFAGNSIGVIVGTLITGLVIDYWKSWVVIFYMWGVVGVIFLIFFALYLFSTPQMHPYISQAELKRVESFIRKKEKFPTPYKKIMSDPAVMALVIGQMGHDYTLFTIVTNLPKYMNNVLRYNMKNNAILSSVPHVAGYIGSVAFGKLADYWLISKNGNVNFCRKLYSAVSFIGAGASCVVASYMDCNRIAALVFFCIAMFFKGLFYCSMKLNAMDLSNNHASFLMGYSNGIGSFAPFFTPYLIGLLAKDNSLFQWHIVFLIVFAVSTITVIIFCLMGTAKRRKWDYTPSELLELEELEKESKPKVKWYLEKPPDVFIADKKKMKEEMNEMKIKSNEDEKKIMEEEKQKLKRIKEEKLAAKKKKKEEKARKKAGNS